MRRARHQQRPVGPDALGGAEFGAVVDVRVGVGGERVRDEAPAGLVVDRVPGRLGGVTGRAVADPGLRTAVDGPLVYLPPRAASPSQAYAILVPSGDQVGDSSLSAVSVSRRRSVPSTPTDHRSRWTVPPGPGSAESKTTVRPSGESSGWAASRSVVSRSTDPSAPRTYTWGLALSRRLVKTRTSPRAEGSWS